MPNNFTGPGQQVTPILDPVTGYQVNAEFTTMRPEDHPNLEPLDPLINDDTKGLRNLTPAEQAAGENPVPVTFLSQKTITLMGGGAPGSIFAAVIDGVLVYERIIDTGPRTLNETAQDVAATISAELPYLRTSASGTTVLVQSGKPTLTITSGWMPLIAVLTIWQGEELPLAGDTITLLFDSMPIYVQLDGTELQADLILTKIYNAFTQSSLAQKAAIIPNFKGSWARSNLSIQFYTPLTVATVTCRGQVAIRMQAQSAGSNNFTFTVT